MIFTGRCGYACAAAGRIIATAPAAVVKASDLRLVSLLKVVSSRFFGFLWSV
jgi:hypothetical protein